MKRIISISLGSSRRDHYAEVEFLGEPVIVERIGTNGSISQAIELIQSWDGKVDAFGMGGIDLYVFAGKKRYTVRDGARIAAAARKTPIVDGSGLKNTLERRVVRFLTQEMQYDLDGKKVLMVSAVDRFGMAEAFTEAGCQMVFGDLMFALGVPIPLTRLESLNRLARCLLPVVTRLPFELLYPTGSKQEATSEKHSRFYHQADVIAGDFLYIKKYLPDHLDGKTILTNTVTPADIEELRCRRAGMLITTTPEITGRSFGTNVMEALIVSFSGKRPEELRESDYERLLDTLEFKPRVVNLERRAVNV